MTPNGKWRPTEEKEVVAAVRAYLESQGFTVLEEELFDETGRSARRVPKDRPEIEKHVLAWFRAYTAGSNPDDLYAYLAGRFHREDVRSVVDALVKSGELVWDAGRLRLGVPRPGPLPLPCPIRLDLYAYRGRDRVERWGVECKGSTGTREGKVKGEAIPCGIGQAYLYSKVCDRAFLAITSEWPRLYEEDQKRHFRLALRTVASDLGFGILLVDPEGHVRKI